jgi:predicted lipoprotein
MDMPARLGWRRLATPLVLGIVLLTAARVPAQTCGDADGDGSLTASDATRILEASALLSGNCDFITCDVDDDGRLTATDGVRLLLLAAGMPGSVQCSDLGPRRGMLRSLVTVVILPGYRALDDAAGGLVGAINALVSAPSAQTLAAARDAWRRARAAWKRTEAFRLGPAESQRTDARVDWAPIRPDRIEEEIAAGNTDIPGEVDALGSTVVGSLAIEYLIFGDGDDGAVIAALTGSAARRAYLAALAANLKERTAALREAWEPAAGNFGPELVNAGLTGGAFPTLKAAVDELVNRVIFTAEVVEEVKLSDPLGLKTGGGPDPTLLESPRSESSRTDALDELRGIQDVYLGRRRGDVGAGISSVLRGIDAGLDAEITGQIAEAIAAVGRIPEPMSETLVTQPDAVEDAYLAVQDMRRSLTLDLAPALGVTLTFGGTDGD